MNTEINVIDVDKVMFGSDYPHPASTWPDFAAEPWR